MAKRKSAWDVHPSVPMYERAIATLKEKTGRSLEEWLDAIEREGPATERERRVWLKAEHGLGTNYSWWIAERSVGKGGDGDPAAYLKAADEFVERMVGGPKAALRPAFDALVRMVRSMGRDVKVCPAQTIVPAYRNHVFAQIRPATRARIDFGLALRDTPTPARLVDTGGFAKKDRITRRIAISSPAEVDDEVRHWTKVAYDMDA
jgi:hypothetical protein